jgi:hypothetical protein
MIMFLFVKSSAVFFGSLITIRLILIVVPVWFVEWFVVPLCVLGICQPCQIRKPV